MNGALHDSSQFFVWSFNVRNFNLKTNIPKKNEKSTRFTIRLSSCTQITTDHPDASEGG